MWLEDANLLSRLTLASPPSLVAGQVLNTVDRADWSALVGHLDFGADTPDSLVVALLGLSVDDDLRAGASFRFMYPGSAWTGPESAHLRTALRRAERWKETPDAPQLFRDWLDETTRVINARITAVENEEAERGY
jgi:hypothetical protein